MSEMQLQALPGSSPIPVAPAVTAPVLPAPADLRPDAVPQRFGRYPK